MGSTLDFFSDPKIQGLLALITIIQLLIAGIKNLSATIKTIRSSWNEVKNATKKPLSNLQLASGVLKEKLSAVALLRILGYFAAGWFFYSIPWILLAIAFKWQFHNVVTMIVSLNFVFLSASVLLGGLVTKPRENIGYFLGGGISLGALAVYLTYASPSMVETISRQAWFLVCMIIGGMFGLFAGTLTAFTANLFKKSRSGPAKEAEGI